MKKIPILGGILLSSYSFSQTLQSVTDLGNSTTNSITIGNSNNNVAMLNIAKANCNQVNITHGNSTYWGLLLGFGDGSFTGGYHGNNHAAIINVRDAPLHLGTHNASRVTILGDGKVGIGTSSPGYKFETLANVTDWSGRFINNANGSAVYFAHGGGYGLHVNTGNNPSANTYALEIYNPNTASSYMYVSGDGRTGIGTSTIPEGYKLAVAGNMVAESVKVALQANWPDYVFHSSYKLPDLKETEQFIKENKHLPEIPSAAEVEKNGINLGEMNSKLLKKIEELTLYLIELKKDNHEIKEENRKQQNEINQLRLKLFP